MNIIQLIIYCICFGFLLGILVWYHIERNLRKKEKKLR